MPYTGEIVGLTLRCCTAQGPCVSALEKTRFADSRTSYDDIDDVDMDLVAAPEPELAVATRRGGSHPHMNNLVFGRRSAPSTSSLSTAGSSGLDEAMDNRGLHSMTKSVCQSVIAACSRWQQQQATAENGAD